MLYPSLLALKGLSGEMNSSDVVIISIPSPGPPQSKYFGSVSSGVCYFTDNLREKGFARR